MIILDGKSKTQTMGGPKGSYAGTTRSSAVLDSVTPIKQYSKEGSESVVRALKAGRNFWKTGNGPVE